MMDIDLPPPDKWSEQDKKMFVMIKLAVKESVQEEMQKVNFRMDNIEQDLASHISDSEKLMECLTLRVLDNELHDRKINLIMSGLPGPKNERPCDTRKSVHGLGLDVFDNSYKPYLKACHRLSPESNSKIIIAFTNLDDRDFWMHNAKWLKRYNIDQNTKISLQPDLPPPLRCLQNELMKIRKDFSNDEKQQSYVKYKPHWPYVELFKKGGKAPILPTTSKSDIIKSVITSK